MSLVAIFIALVFLLSLVSGRLERTIVTAPIVFTGAGMAIALIGTRLSRATVLFMDWFGPRGLASIVLGLVYLEQHTHQSGESAIRLAVMATVLLSIFAHGLSALPGMDIYARKISTLPPAAAELEGSPAENPDLTANPAHHPYVGRTHKII